MTNYREQAAAFNEKMGLSETARDQREDGLIWFTVIAEEVGEVMDAVNSGESENVGEELADVVVSCYTCADAFDLVLPESFEVEERRPRYKDRAREQAAAIYAAVNSVRTAVEFGDETALRGSLSRVVAHCHQAAAVMDVDLAAEFDAKMEYNMQKSGATEAGKVVDDVESDDE